MKKMLLLQLLMYELNMDLFKNWTPCSIASRIYEDNQYMYQTVAWLR